jgi:hypothetical protein
MLVSLMESTTSLSLALVLLVLHDLLLIHNVLVHYVLSYISLHVTIGAVAQGPNVVVVLLELLLELLLLQKLLLILP